jgi:hypothetical protein
MEKIQNPEKQSVMLTFVGMVLGVIVIIIPFIFKSIAIYQFYFTYVGIVIIIFAIGFWIYFSRRLKQCDVFLENKDQALVWEYEEQEYKAFVGELTTLQKTSSKKKVWILLGIELVISIILFILLSPESKWFSAAFFIIFGGISLIFTLVMPNTFKYRAMIKPYVTIIDFDSAYIMGRYHRWTKAKAKVKDYDNGEKVYQVLSINYEAMSRNGKLFREWTAMIPNSDNKEVMQEAKKYASQINKLSRKKEKSAKEKKSYLEQLFLKMLGKTKEKKEVKKSIETKSK